MNAVFWISGIITIICAAFVVTRTNAMHALIGLVLVFVSTAAVFASLGAPLVAVLQIIIYAGAVMVLFVFIVMMLNLGPTTELTERAWLGRRILILPAILGIAQLALVIVAIAGGTVRSAPNAIGPKAVGMSLFKDYYIGVEVASLLLLAGLVGAFHFGLPRESEGDHAG